MAVLLSRRAKLGAAGIPQPAATLQMEERAAAALGGRAARLRRRRAAHQGAARPPARVLVWDDGRRAAVERGCGQVARDGSSLSRVARGSARRAA
eukprot:3436643-Prymnesium_polylepis.1